MYDLISSSNLSKMLKIKKKELNQHRNKTNQSVTKPILEQLHSARVPVGHIWKFGLDLEVLTLILVKK